METKSILLCFFSPPYHPQRVSSLDKETCLEATEERGTPVKSRQFIQGRTIPDLLYTQNALSEIYKLSLTLKYLQLEI